MVPLSPPQLLPVYSSNHPTPGWREGRKEVTLRATSGTNVFPPQVTGDGNVWAGVPWLLLVQDNLTGSGSPSPSIQETGLFPHSDTLWRNVANYNKHTVGCQCFIQKVSPRYACPQDSFSPVVSLCLPEWSTSIYTLTPAWSWPAAISKIPMYWELLEDNNDVK